MLKPVEGRALLIVRHVIDCLVAEAAQAYPRECCGLLLGEATINSIVPAANVAFDPVRRFEIDAAVLIAAHKSERAGGARLAGYYHSHPSGDPLPSVTDREAASGDGRVWAIVARGQGTDWKVRFWRDSPSGFEALSSTVVGG